MKAAELRIGNTVTFNNENVSVIEVSPRFVNVTREDWGRYNIPIDKIAPINITEEWIKKLGFWYNEDRQRWLHKMVSNGDFVLSCHPDNNPQFYQIWIEYVHQSPTKEVSVRETLAGVNLYFVHQLQNFFYAMTGEQLPVIANDEEKNERILMYSKKITIITDEKS